jgi:hypothetical protein
MPCSEWLAWPAVQRHTLGYLAATAAAASHARLCFVQLLQQPGIPTELRTAAAVELTSQQRQQLHQWLGR